jgi:hypothetical protein
MVSDAVSVITGLENHSLSLLAVRLGILADVTGSAILIWRLRAERRAPGQSQTAEVCPAIVVTGALAIVSAVITVQAAIALATGSCPGTSSVNVIAAGAPLAVLTPLACSGPQSHADSEPAAVYLTAAGSAHCWARTSP